MINISDNIVENQNTYFKFRNAYQEIMPFMRYHVLWKNVEQSDDTDNNLIWRMRTKCWITKIINTNS